MDLSTQLFELEVVLDSMTKWPTSKLVHHGMNGHVNK